MSDLAVNITPLGEKPEPQRRARRDRLDGVRQGDSRSQFVSEDAFIHMLCLERKRAERSRKPFLLLLLDSGTLLNGLHKKRLFSKLVAALSTSMRETDIRGWYEENSILGVIYSEIAGDKRTACDAILSKVVAALRKRLEPRQFEEIRLTFKGSNQKKASRLIKRTLDVLGSLLALILLFPLFLAIALIIKLTSKGPVLFRQERVGQFGARFTFVKFRTMHTVNSDQIHKEYVKRLIAGQVEGSKYQRSEKPVFKITEDPRVTWVGKILRRTSLDELPQFFNVLLGEMSLVGPRPPVPYEVESYDVWHRRRVLEAKPGITGLWQVNGRSQTSFDDMVRLDLQYVRRCSLWLDIKILLQTPAAVFSGKGAY